MTVTFKVPFPMLPDVELRFFSGRTPVGGWIAGTQELIDSQHLGYFVEIDDSVITLADNYIWRSLSSGVASPPELIRRLSTDTGGRVLLQPAQPNVTIPLVTNLFGHTPQTGDAFARLGAGGAGLNALGDPRVANLDAAVSSRAATGAAMTLADGERTSIAAAIWGAATRTLSAFAFTVNTNANATETAIKTKTDNLPAIPAAVGSAMTLAPAERTAIANEVEAHLLNEGDSQMLINAIVGAIGNSNIDQTILVGAIRADLERPNGNLNTLVVRLTEARLAKLDVTGVIANTANADTFKADVSLLATQSSVSAIGTSVTNIVSIVDNIKTVTDKFIFGAGNFVKSAAQSLANYVAPLSAAATRTEVGNALANYDAATISDVKVSGGFDAEARAHLLELQNTDLSETTVNADLGELPEKLNAVYTKVLTLGTSKLVVTTPVEAAVNARVTRGGDYYASDGRALEFSLVGATMGFRDRIATVEFIVEDQAPITASFENIEDGILVRVELSRVQTSAFSVEKTKLFLRATLQDGRKIPLLRGVLTVEDGAE